MSRSRQGCNSFLGLGVLFLVMIVPVAAARLPVFVSIPPQAFLLERIGGERVRIGTMLGSNANPHNYDPAPRQLVSLAAARSYFTIGIPFEDMWQPRMAGVNPALEFIHCGTERRSRAGRRHAPGHEHDEHSDPHIWTSPVEAQRIARCMRDALVRLDPDAAAIYDRNLDNLLAELAQLHREIGRLLANLTPRVMLVQHPAWDYFTATYDFEQLAIERAGHEPNARHLVRVIERARKLKLDKVFVQRQSSQAAARLVAEAIGAGIIEVDPMARDYPASLRRLARSLAATRGPES